MHSMTGFGRGVAEHGGVRATIDIRSVNHRYVDLKLRAQVGPALEDAITARVRGAIERGAIAVSLRFERSGFAGPRSAAEGRRGDEIDRPRGGVAIQVETARAVHAELTGLAHELGVGEPDLALVLAQPGVVASADAELEPEGAVLAALDAALRQLVEMRATEGRALAAELTQRLDALARLREQIEGLAAGVPEHVKRRLDERLKKLLGDETPVDATRLAQEVALLADRADLTEELVRLGSHLDQARALIAGEGAAGRRLEFLVQELGRELNTIGSKAQLAEISSLVVEAKALLEKLREQVQNVE